MTSSKIVISDYNADDDKRGAALSYSGNSLNIDADLLYITKFKITSSNIPVWIPNIVKTPYLYNSGVYTANTTVGSGFWNTDMTISILNTSTNHVVNCPIQFNPLYSRYPNNEPNHLTIPTRSEVLNNDFFYTFTSMELLKMIQEAVNLGLQAHGLADNLFLMVKNEASYQLLLNTSVNTDTYKLYVNAPFQRLFNLHYMTTLVNGWQSVYFDSKINYDVNNITYNLASTLSFTTRMFPFVNLIFSSSNLPVQQIQTITNINTTKPTAITEIFSYYLTITDVDAVGDCIFFIASSYFDGNPITTKIDHLKLSLFFETADNYYIPLTLYPSDSVSLTMSFVNE